MQITDWDAFEDEPKIIRKPQKQAIPDIYYFTGVYGTKYGRNSIIANLAKEHAIKYKYSSDLIQRAERAYHELRAKEARIKELLDTRNQNKLEEAVTYMREERLDRYYDEANEQIRRWNEFDTERKRVRDRYSAERVIQLGREYGLVFDEREIREPYTIKAMAKESINYAKGFVSGIKNMVYSLFRRNVEE